MAEKKAFVFDTNFIIQNQNLNDACCFAKKLKRL